MSWLYKNNCLKPFNGLDFDDKNPPTICPYSENGALRFTTDNKEFENYIYNDRILYENMYNEFHNDIDTSYRRVNNQVYQFVLLKPHVMNFTKKKVQLQGKERSFVIYIDYHKF